MYLIITTVAAVMTTIIWRTVSPRYKSNIGLLCLIYWGATLMWAVDHVIAYLSEGGEFFEMTLSSTLLGFSSVLLGILAWAIILLIKSLKLKKAPLQFKK